MSVERQSVRGLKWRGLSKLASQVVTWVITLAVLRLLAPSDYGLMAMLSVLITLLGNVADFGVGSSLIQAKETNGEEIARVTGLVVISNVAIFLSLLAAAPLVSRFYAEPRLTMLTQVAALQFLFNAISTIPQTLAAREMRFGWLSLVDLITAVAGGVVTIVMAWRGAGVWSLLVGNLAQVAIKAAMLCHRGIPKPSFSLTGMRSHIEFGSVMTVLRLIMQIVAQSDVIVAGRLLTPQAVGLYSVSVHFATLPMQKIMGTINQVAFPAVSRLQLEPERLRTRILEATRLLLHALVPVLWGMSATAAELVQVALGSQWTGAVKPMQIVCLAVPFQVLNFFYSTAAAGMRDIRASIHNTVASALVLPIAFYFGARSGVNGLAYAWAIGIPIAFLLRVGRTVRSVHVTPRDLLTVAWAPFAAAGVMYAAVTICRWFSPELNIYLRLPLMVVIGALSYLGTTVVIDKRAVSDTLRFVAALRA